MNIKVLLIALCNAAGFCAASFMVFVGSILGAKMSYTSDLATLPITAMVVGTAVGTVPVSLLSGKIGSKSSYSAFFVVGALSCVLASVAISTDSFWVYCLSCALIGSALAAVQQLRFVAMESVSIEKAATAAAIVLCGGIVAAFVGPELVVIGQHFTGIEYQGSFWLLAVCFLFAALLLLSLKLPDKRSAVKKQQARPLSHMLRSPEFCLAVASASVAYVTMTFVMTATPISMHHHHGHSLTDTKWVIQSHIIAMFLPSLFTAWLLRLLSLRALMALGVVCYLLTIVIGFADTSVFGFWWQLVLLGIGWNFLFIAGTTLLPSTYLEGEQYKARAFNDGFVFSCQALASLSAGWVINLIVWQNLLALCVIPVAFMVGVLVWARKPPASFDKTGIELTR